MVVSFNRYLPVILPEIDDSEPDSAIVASDVGSPDVKQRASYTTDEPVARNCSTSTSTIGVGGGGGPTTTASVTTPAVTVTTSAVTVPLCILGEVQLRFLCPDDLEEVRSLCQDWFPIGEHLSWKQHKLSCLQKNERGARLKDIFVI